VIVKDNGEEGGGTSTIEAHTTAESFREEISAAFLSLFDFIMATEKNKF
jgi:hypothetical protein